MSLFGQVVGYFITFGTSHLSTDWSWRAPYMMQCLLAVIFGLSMLPMPYSPRWLVFRGRSEEALASLVSLRGVDAENPIIKQEYQEIVDELEFEKSLGKRSYLELFERKNRKQFFSALFVGVGTAFLGTVAICKWKQEKTIMMTDCCCSLFCTPNLPGSWFIRCIIFHCCYRWYWFVIFGVSWCLFTMVGGFFGTSYSFHYWSWCYGC